MRRTAGALAGLLLLAAPLTAVAHDSFLIPPASVAAGQPFVVQVTSSGFFPEPETTIRPNRISRLIARSGDAPLVATPAPGEVAMQIALSPPGDAGAVIGVSLSPWPIEVGADERSHYMDEIGALPALRAAVEAGAAADGVLHETYTKHLKAIVCGRTCAGVGAERPLGFYLEFVLDPARPRTFLLLRNGAPLASLPVFATTGNRGRLAFITDATGAVSLPEGLTGPVLLMAVDLQPPERLHARFTSEWAALTFDARLLAD